MRNYFRQLKVYLGIFLGLFLLLFLVEILMPAKVSGVDFILGKGSRDRIVVSFDRLMDRDSVDLGLEIFPAVKYEKIWNGRSLVINFGENLSDDLKYQLKIDGKVLALDGKNLGAGLVKSFELPAKKILVNKFNDEGSQFEILDLKSDSRKVSGRFGVKVRDWFYLIEENAVIGLGSAELDSTDVDIYSLSLKGGGDQLFRIDLESGEIRWFDLGSGFDNKRLLVSHDGKKVILARVVKSDSGENLSRIKLYIADYPELKFREFNGGNAESLDFLFSPDSKGLAFRNSDGNFEIKGLEDEGEGIFLGEFSDVLDFHPFLPEVLFSMYDQSDIFSIRNDLVRFKGDGSKDLLKIPVGVVKEAKYSGDGKTVFFVMSKLIDEVSDVESFFPLRVYHVYKYDLESGFIEQLTSGMEYSEESLSVSADGSKIYYLRYSVDDLVEVDPEYRNLYESVAAKVQLGDLIEMDLRSGEENVLMRDVKSYSLIQ